MPNKPVGEARERSGARKEPKRQRSREDRRKPSKSESRPSVGAPQSGRNHGEPTKDPAAELKEKSRAYGALAGSSHFGAQRVVMAAETRGIGRHIDDWDGLADRLDVFAAKVNGGDMTEVERMLAHQAVALQSMFVHLTEGALSAETLPNFDLKLRYALRAQSQCRATLETLAAIKNPPVLFARQANVTTGPQQINNAVGSLAHAGGNGSEQIELSEASHELRQNAGTPALTVGDDPPMAPMGTIDGTSDAGRQGTRVPQRLEGRHARDAPPGRPRPSRAKASTRKAVSGIG